MKAIVHKCQSAWMLAALFIAPTLQASPLPVVPTANTEFNFYEVDAANIIELFSKIREIGPAGPAGNRAAAHAKYHIDWQVVTEQKGAQCQITDAEVLTKVEIIVPQWRNVDTLDAKSNEYWDKYLNALLAHEGGHKTIVAESAEKIASYINTLKPQKDCAQLLQLGNNFGQQQVAAARLRGDKYNQNTKLQFD